MGVCCIKHTKQDQNEFLQPQAKEDYISLYEGNKEIQKKITKIQSTFRMFKAIKQFRLLKKDKENAVILNQKLVSSNPKVVEMEEKLGPFKHENAIERKGKLEKRPITEVSNGAKYLGEWNVETNMREGYGTQIWEDGSK